jgi:hypothetical protein
MADRRYFKNARHAVNSNNSQGSASMEHTERHRHGGLLYPLLIAAAIAVIVFSIIGIATMTGVVPNAATREGAARQTGEQKGKPARIEAPKRAPAPASGNPRTAMGAARAAS